MTYVPHTEGQRRRMLAEIGVESLDDLFLCVPASQRYPQVDLPRPISELELVQELRQLSERNVDLDHAACFLGAGAYRHFVPAVVDAIVSRSEFYTAYTPYQPEISQGTLQSIFEYQSMICALTDMEVSNASHYDGATAMAEAIVMADAVARGRRGKVVLSPGIHPEYRQTVHTYTQGMHLEIVGEALSPDVEMGELLSLVDDDTSCLIVQTPDFLGRIHDLRGVAQAVHDRGALLVVACDPISLGLLAPPGQYDADVVVGEGQALGNSLSFGGPYFGFFACREENVRRMAGRVVGETVDVEGRRGYVLTLSTREQHIRRQRASSNICTNQGLNTLAAGVYLGALGKSGLRQVAELCYHRAHYAAKKLDQLPGFRLLTQGPFFKEFVLRCPAPVAQINDRLLHEHDIVGGYDLGNVWSQRENEMLVCVTEMNDRDEIDRFAAALKEVAR